MNKIDQKSLFFAIKADNLALFSNSLGQNLNFCFGRFPILSVCYLYSSKKILRKFEKKLLQIDDYSFGDEPFVLVKDFHAKAGRALRLFQNQNSIVLPIEMLAILHCDKKVQKLFKKIQNCKKSYEKLLQIYQINGQTVAQKNDEIHISPQKLSPFQKRFFAPFQIVSVCSLVLFLSIFGICFSNFGFGTKSFPSKIYSQSQLQNIAVASNHNLILQNDVTLTNKLSIKKFSGILDGNNHTITIKYAISTSIFENLQGVVKNLNIEFGEQSVEFSKSFGLLCNQNQGTIQNVNANGKISLLMHGDGTSTNFATLALTNKGQITNCNVKLNATAQNLGENDAYVAGIAFENSSKIDDCVLAQGSSISSQTVDISGIASQNYLGGTITNCKNFASLEQKASLGTWSPNVAGIVIGNVGTVSNCFNHGQVSVISTGANTSASLFAGGICAINNSAINKCQNFADILTDSQNAEVYVGGICAYSQNSNNQNAQSVVSNCGTSGKITLTKASNDALAFCGGIAGLFIGSMQNCFSQMTFGTTFDETSKMFVGLAVGTVYYQYNVWQNQIQFYIQSEKIYCLRSKKTELAIACMLSNGGYQKFGDYDLNIILFDTNNEIENCEAFWNE